MIDLCALFMDTENGLHAIKWSIAGPRCSSKEREKCLCSGVTKSEIVYKKILEVKNILILYILHTCLSAYKKARHLAFDPATTEVCIWTPSFIKDGWTLPEFILVKYNN